MEVTTVEVTSKNVEHPRKLPRSILIIFLTFQFVIGFDFGFHGVLKRGIRRFFKYYSRVVCFAAFIVLGIPIIIYHDSVQLIFAMINLMQFAGSVLSLFIAKYNVYDFITDIRDLDCSVRRKETFGGVSACAFCILIFTFNLVVRFVICSIASNGCRMIENWAVQLLLDVFMMCLDVLHVAQSLVNYYAYCAAKCLKYLVDIKKSDTHDIRQQFIYIADCCDKIRPLYGNLFLTQLLVGVPKLLLILTFSLKNATSQITWLLQCINAVYATIVVVQLCSPAAVVELAKKQMEGVRLMLYTRLLDEKDMEKNVEMVNLLRYMKARPIYHKVCRIFPVDIKLVVVLFSFVSTYLIVIIQFTHIYD